MRYSTEIRKDGEIRRLKTKCKHASEELEKIYKSIQEWDLTTDENKDDLIEWIDSLREYLNQE